MRELLFKHLTSGGTSRRVLSISETVDENGLQICTQRRCSYMLKSRFHIKDAVDIKSLKKQAKTGSIQKRHIQVVRKRDSITGEHKLYCKVKGLLYVVIGNYVYLISFTNSFKIYMQHA